MIGSNDEANGHGTIYVNWYELNKILEPTKTQLDTKKLIAFLQLTNIYVGDAICNMLMCESALRDMDMTIKDFKELYTELPNRLFKCSVDDRKIFKTTPDESRLIEPI